MSKVWFETHGCSTNFSESEMMGGFLLEVGHSVVQDKEEADVLVLNICTVKGTENAEEQISRYYSYCNENGKWLVVTGCIPFKAFKKLKALATGASFISTHNISKIAEAVECAVSGMPIDLITKTGEEKAGVARVRVNPNIAIIQINNSCSGACSFCSTVLIKGKLQTYDRKKVLQDVSTSIKEGCGEIWLTSMDTASFGLDTNDKSQLPSLLKDIVAINGDFRVRVGMLNPDTILPVADEMIEAMKSDKVFKFLHIPIQAGSDSVLEGMNRKYTQAEFLDVVGKFKKAFPSMSLATDVIVGFPGESDDDFLETLKVVKAIEPDSCHIARFQAREATLAATMKDKVQGNVAKERSRQLTELHQEIGSQVNKKWIDWEGWCFVSEKKKNYVARNGSYKPIVLKEGIGDVDLKGKWVKVKIVDSTVYHLLGKVLEVKEKMVHGLE